jgi:hypothetical protein
VATAAVYHSAATCDDDAEFDSPLVEAFAIKLERGWDHVPVHHTDANCWHCGEFASAGRVTKRNLKEGWQVVTHGEKTVGIFCNEKHKLAYAKNADSK